MIYSICVLEICHTPYRMYLAHVGNMYAVGLYNTETKETTESRFATIDEAYKVFGTLAEWYAKSLYSQEQKEMYLITGAIPT